MKTRFFPSVSHFMSQCSGEYKLFVRLLSYKEFTGSFTCFIQDRTLVFRVFSSTSLYLRVKSLSWHWTLGHILTLLIAKKHLFSLVITFLVFTDNAIFFFIVKEKPFLTARTFLELTDNDVRMLFVERTFFLAASTKSWSINSSMSRFID